jgi:hypothetical protein
MVNPNAFVLAGNQISSRLSNPIEPPDLALTETLKEQPMAYIDFA